VKYVRKILWFALSLAVLFGAVRTAKWFIESKPTAARAPTWTKAVTVEVATAETTQHLVHIHAMGTVVPAAVVQIRPEVTGRVEVVHPNLVQGGLVSAGDVLARLDDRDYALAVAQQKAQVARSELELKQERSRQKVAEREWALLDTGDDSSEEGRALALRMPQIVAAKASLESAKSTLQRSRLALEKTEIRAPFNAMVQTESVELGLLAGPTTPLATLVGTDEYWVEVAIPVDDLHWLDVPGVGGTAGSKAKIVHDTGNHHTIVREGTVVRLLGELDPAGRMARLLVAVPDPLGLSVAAEERGLPLLLGAYVRVELTGRHIEGVVPVPRTAVREGDELWVMSADKTLEVREAGIAFRTDDTVFVDSGIAVGERYVTSRIGSPSPGMKLQVSGEPDEPPAETHGPAKAVAAPAAGEPKGGRL
jgi:RND family efflux transporter MFP subunit